MGDMSSDSTGVERRESLPLIGSSEQGAARDKPSRKNAAKGLPSEQLEEAEQDAEDPTHEKKVPPKTKSD
jgi:hypothetical protein